MSTHNELFKRGSDAGLILKMALVLLSVSPAADVAERQPDKTEILPIPNGGFEGDLSVWRIEEPDRMCKVSADHAASGKKSLRVTDTNKKRGSNAYAPRVAVDGGGVYELRGKVYPISGSGLGIYVTVLGKDGKALPAHRYQRGLGGSDKKWQPFKLPVYASRRAAFLQLWIHSYNAAEVDACLDDLQFVSLGKGNLDPPWKGQYKIRPEEKERLTPADVIGPDGIVYPNWTKVGVQGGIPEVEVVYRIEEFGAEANDDEDDSSALDKACIAAGEKGGGAVLLGQGTYYLDRPVTVRHNNVVIRGAGQDKTRIVFRYAIPETGVAFYHPQEGKTIGKSSRIILHCRPNGLRKMTIMLGDVVLRTWQRGKHSGNTFECSTTGSAASAKLRDGSYTLTGIAGYRGGKKVKTQIQVELKAAHDELQKVPSTRAAITFNGEGWASPRIKLTADGKRGDQRLQAESTEVFAVGDCILIDGPPTPRWKKLTKNACSWGSYRRYEVIVEKVEGRTLTINQPLRLEFPIIDGSYVQKVIPIEKSGIEDLTLEQTQNLWITGVMFSHAMNCWAKNITVKKCGRHPVYARFGKWCEIRDCVFDDAWFKGGGGTAYAGWEHSWDCLMEGCETFKLRHAPLFQWSASGCVIRKSVFHESDGQWHSGWTNENLMEQCIITSRRGHGSYGFGLWASPPEDTAHGPNGPRNVVYNCDVSSERDGLWMGGMNEGWIILHNRFVVEKGRGIYARTSSFDHIIKGNVFVLKDNRSPMAYFATPDCIGIELIGNKLFGGGGLVSGLADPELSGNTKAALTNAPRPQLAIPSIYEWQKSEKK